MEFLGTVVVLLLLAIAGLNLLEAHGQSRDGGE